MNQTPQNGQTHSNHSSAATLLKKIVGCNFIKKDTLGQMFSSSHRECSIKKVLLKNFVKFTGKHLCQSLFFDKVAGPRPATLLKKETLAQVVSWEFCDILNNTFSPEHQLATTSGCFPVHFAKLIVTLFYRTLPGDCILLTFPKIITNVSKFSKILI